MPVKLRRSKKIGRTITAEAVAAYRDGDVGTLMLALGMAPWECSPLWCDDGPRPSHATDMYGWEQAQEIRRALESMGA